MFGLKVQYVRTGQLTEQTGDSISAEHPLTDANCSYH